MPARRLNLLIASAFILATAAAPALAADTAATAAPAPAAQKAKKTRRGGLDAHIQQLHDQLKVTDAQAPQWNAVAKVMRDDSAEMSALVKEKRKQIATMTAVQDLENYSQIASTHAEHAKRMTAAFTALYNVMPSDQKKVADTVFREEKRKMSQWTR